MRLSFANYWQDNALISGDHKQSHNLKAHHEPLCHSKETPGSNPPLHKILRNIITIHHYSLSLSLSLSKPNKAYKSLVCSASEKMTYNRNVIFLVNNSVKDMDG